MISESCPNLDEKLFLKYISEKDIYRDCSVPFLGPRSFFAIL